MRNFRTWFVLVIALVILSLGCCAMFVLGQGGTGRTTANANANRKAPGPKRTPASRRTPRTGGATPPANNPGQQTSDEPKVNDTADERAYWETIKLSIDPEDFRAYLNKYPNGLFVTLAQNNLARLEAARVSRSACPAAITVDCTSAPIKQGTPAVFIVNVTAGNPITPSYNWSVSAGRISSGQGSSAITVDTSGLSGYSITATVELAGLNAVCTTRTASCTSTVAAAAAAPAKSKPGDLVRNQLGMEFVNVPPGTFMMGSNNGEANEKPVHEVTIREGFYMGRYEVTQAEWRQVMGNNPSYFQGDNLPVEQVSWGDAQSFISKLNERGDGFKYRLPSEAEWEYACRAGTTRDFAFGNALSSDQANFNGTYPYGGAANGVYRQRTIAVGSFAPNAFGLYDMHGNVWEWCEDWQHASYEGAPNDGSAWLNGSEQKYRVLRGGSWSDNASGLRSAFRYWLSVAGRYDSFGFRVVAIGRIQ